MQNTRLAALDFDLGPEIDMLRATVRGFAEDRIAPLAAEIDRTDRFPVELWPRDGRARAARHHRRGGIWRRRHGLPRALRRDGGGEPRLGLGRALLRRPLEPLRQPDPPQRQRGAEAQIPAEADLGRACRRAGDERAGRRLRCRLDAAARRQDEATATCSTAASCGSPTAITPTPWWSMPRPGPTPARAASPPF